MLVEQLFSPPLPGFKLEITATCTCICCKLSWYLSCSIDVRSGVCIAAAVDVVTSILAICNISRLE